MGGLPREFAREFDNLDSGEVCVASGDAGASCVLPWVFKRPRQDYPDIRAHLRRCVQGEGLGLLLAEDVELWFEVEGPVSMEFEYRPVLSYDLVLIASRDHAHARRDSVTPQLLKKSPPGQ